MEAIILGVILLLWTWGQAEADLLVDGRVRLDSGEPAAGAQVLLFNLSDLAAPLVAATTDAAGKAAAAGVYLYRLSADEVRLTRRMMLIDGGGGGTPGRVSGTWPSADQALSSVLSVLPPPTVVHFFGDPEASTGLGRIACWASMLEDPEFTTDILLPGSCSTPCSQK